MQRLKLHQIKEAQKSLRHLNAFINFANQDGGSAVQPQKSRGSLYGIQIAVKDNICTNDLPTTCASQSLKGYTSPFDATAVRLLRAAGASITGKTNLDEFGMGSHSLHSSYGPVRSNYGSRSAGGSSGGSAVAVASGQCHVALGTDTGGSVRLPAAYTGTYGFKPSYGRISRWGVVAYANSLDTVGVLADDIPSLRSVYQTLDAYDEQDPTSMSRSVRSRSFDLLSNRKPRHGLRFGVPEQYRVEELSPIVRQAWSKTLDYLKRLGHSVHTVSLPRTQEALSAYYVLAPAEASSNLAKYDGVRYGTHADPESAKLKQLYAATRQQGFGEEVRRRILLGAHSLSANAIDNYFIKAQKIRRLVQEDFDAVFDLPNALSSESEETHVAQDDGKVDALICPTSTDLPPLLEDAKKQTPLEAYAGDVLTVPASLAGLPALNIPVGIDEFVEDESYVGPSSVGMQVIVQYGDDDAALAIGKMMQPLRHLSVEQAHAAFVQSLVQPWIEQERGNGAQLAV